MWQKYIPNIQVFLVVNNLIYMIEIVYIWLKSDSESYHRFKPPKYENSMLGMFSCDITVVANDVIMQRTQRCPGLSETRQVNRYIVIWLARSLRAHEASQHVIGLIWVVHWLYCSGCWFHHLDSAYLHIILQILRFAVKLCWLNMETWLWGDFFFFFF